MGGAFPERRPTAVSGVPVPIQTFNGCNWIVGEYG